MIHCAIEELLKLAELSALQLDDEEVKAFGPQLEVLLEYLDELNEVQIIKGLDAARNINVFREDRVVITDSKGCLEQAPLLSGTAIVVPRILD